MTQIFAELRSHGATQSNLCSRLSIGRQLKQKIKLWNGKDSFRFFGRTDLRPADYHARLPCKTGEKNAQKKNWSKMTKKNYNVFSLPNIQKCLENAQETHRMFERKNTQPRQYDNVSRP
jgi:hypothetical protein